VTNPLCGPSGAAYVYGPQKGASPQQVQQLDIALGHLASLTKTDPNTPGAGAAGGVGFGLAAFCGATLEPGIDLILEAVRFRQRCQGADLVLTGEGCLDIQSLHGKATMGVAQAAADIGVPTIAIVGSTGPGAEARIKPDPGGLFDDVISLTERFGLQRSMAETAPLLEKAVADVIRQHLR
jgi:glycerate kinase